MERNLLEINRISKRYGNKIGINNLSLNIKGGEVACIIGPNGSGKSTSIRIISGVMKADTGECWINAMNTEETDTKKYIGYLEENPFIYEDLTIYQFIHFVSSIKKIDRIEVESERLLKKFDLWDNRNMMIKNLSMGMRKRVSIITAIMSYPPLMILDEPTNGLDTKSIISLKEEILSARKNQSIVMVSSHILDFLKQIGTVFIFIKEGQVIKMIHYSDGLDLDEVYKDLYIRRESSCH